MNSRLYTGNVTHVRFTPVSHRFVYPIFAFCLDLDDLPALDRELPGFGYNRRNLVSLWDDDYLRGSGSIRSRLMGFLGESGCADGVARVELITMPRVAGTCFNPVSFYYCYGEDGLPRCHVAEVNNTFGERHLYILRDKVEGQGAGPYRYRQDKQFHVSPFNNTAGQYDMVFGVLADRLRVTIELWREGERVMMAGLSGDARVLNAPALRATLARYPFTALSTLPRIHWQAAKLYFRKKLPINRKPVPEHHMTIKTTSPSRRQRVCRALVQKLFARIEQGKLVLVLPDGTRQEFGDATAEAGYELVVRNAAFFTRLVADGDVGLGESFTAGEWETDDLTGLFSLLIDNADSLSAGAGWLGGVGRGLNRLRHMANRNTLLGSRRNIEAHYDLGNTFYETFLDPETMMYSCGLHETEDATLGSAQRCKLRRIIELAQLGPDDHVLEIGCGWGGFAIEAVRRTGCRVTGITLSKEQLAYARERVEAAGLSDRIAFELCDYRHVKGAFSKIVSIEMLEAVGHDFYGTYLAACDRLLQPGGRVVLQVITIPDQRYDAYRSKPDWIQKHIFPGGMLPSLTELTKAMTRDSSLQVEFLDNIGPRYPWTLRQWRERFNNNRQALLDMGYDEAFQRKWNYYLCYCEAGFAKRFINDIHMVLTRPAAG